MATTTITNTMLSALRTRVSDLIAYAQYMVGTTWYHAELESNEIQANGAVHITFYVLSHGYAQATKFRLCDSEGSVLVERVENVTFGTGMDKVMYRFKFGVSVGT